MTDACSKTLGSSNIGTYSPDAPCDDPGIHSTESLLPGPLGELGNSADIGAQLASLVLTSAHQQKEVARESRRASEIAQREAENQELDAMRREAECKLTAGLFESGASVASGAMTVVGAGSEKVTETRLTGSAAIVKGLGTLDAALANHDAATAAEAGRAQSSVAAREKRAADDARDLGRDAKEQIDRALSYYKEYLTAKSDTQRATLLKA